MCKFILLQKLRDTLQIKSLYSYAIKTVAIWLMASGDLSKTDKIDMAFLKVRALFFKGYFVC